LIIEARGYPQAASSLPTKVCGTRHIDNPPTDCVSTPEFPSGSGPDRKTMPAAWSKGAAQPARDR
jgi:hypothetical protein